MVYVRYRGLSMLIFGRSMVNNEKNAILLDVFLVFFDFDPVAPYF